MTQYQLAQIFKLINKQNFMTSSIELLVHSCRERIPSQSSGDETLAHKLIDNVLCILGCSVDGHTKGFTGDAFVACAAMVS